ncbi:hypothetical protein ILUMI_23241 [Ignelater luminosus]|uniref:Uncharacterized protein n=1 Tax=Ignelater luminosus TaxID=2038154 RepID=A0A8K0CCD9_IGNLU|nr:hypothetical protein ILUMI_23241 [Ignelater luminosus]
MSETMRIRFSKKIVKEAKNKIAQKTPEDFQRLVRYDAVKTGSSEKVIVSVKNEGEPIICDCHLAIDQVFFLHQREPTKSHRSITKNGVSKKPAALEFNVPGSTLIQKSSLAAPPRRNMSPATELYEMEEIMIEGWVIVPTPFKKCLVLPKTSDETMKTPKHRKKMFPAVASSEKFRQFYKREINKKRTQKMTKQTLIKTTGAGEESSSESDMDVTCDDKDLDLSEIENLGKKSTHNIERIATNFLTFCRNHSETRAEVRTMVNAGIDSWKWPLMEDVLYYFIDAFICVIQKLQQKNNRGHYTVSDMEKYN